MSRRGAAKRNGARRSAGRKRDAARRSSARRKKGKRNGGSASRRKGLSTGISILGGLGLHKVSKPLPLRSGQDPEGISREVQRGKRAPKERRRAA